MRTTVATLVVLLVAALPVAHAREAEWRFSVGTVGTVETIGAAGETASAAAIGGSARWAYGLTNNWELGADLRFVTQLASADVDQVEIDGQPGTLRASFFAGELGVDLRYSFSVKHALTFARTAPFVGLRAGLATRYLHDQYLLDPSSGESVFAVDDDLQFAPFAGLDLGVQHRFSRTFALGLTAGASYGPSDYSSAQLALEAIWHWY